VTATWAELAARKPRCAIKNPPDSPVLRGLEFASDAVLYAGILNRCIDPVMEMGTFACLQYYDGTFDNTPTLVECFTNKDSWPLRAPHETDVFIMVDCDYTTVPRQFSIEGFAWAYGLDGKFYRSPNVESRRVLRFCHVSRPRWEEDNPYFG
jgi:hypothetical protein